MNLGLTVVCVNVNSSTCTSACVRLCLCTCARWPVTLMRGTGAKETRELNVSRSRTARGAFPYGATTIFRNDPAPKRQWAVRVPTVRRVGWALQKGRVRVLSKLRGRGPRLQPHPTSDTVWRGALDPIDQDGLGHRTRLELRSTSAAVVTTPRWRY